MAAFVWQLLRFGYFRLEEVSISFLCCYILLSRSQGTMESIMSLATNNIIKACC